ncbi:DUF4232 domain-containing protein [Streptomyces griseosporeus]|uniref:DUF4232 domain-containing protein n=1 Tax=Streptomyces griseosporeus TaxID=1910 RepID=UPI0036F8020E
MPHTKRATTAIVSVCAVSALLAGCGGGDGTSDTTGSAPQPTRTAGPSHTADTAGAAGTPGTTPSASLPGASTAGAGSSGGPLEPAGSPGTGRAGATSRCHTSELSASVGRNDPGAGQENFPVVLTNTSSRTCTVHGYPGAAFVGADGRQLGPDPRRQTGVTARTVTLAPGHSAWAGLRFANPEISGARTAVPAALLVTPPDERDPLKVPWKGGKVPVGGNESVVWLSVLAPGTAP